MVKPHIVAPKAKKTANQGCLVMVSRQSVYATRSGADAA